MKSEEKDEAARLAARAKRQASNATKNGIKAVEAVADPVIEGVADEIHDTADKLNGTADDAVRAARKADPRVVLATLAVVVGGTYLAGRFVGAREARERLATELVTEPLTEH